MSPGSAPPPGYPTPSAQVGPDAALQAAGTEAFQLDLPTLALSGLREIAGSLIPQRTLETSGDIARFVTKLHDSMEVFCRTFIPLRQGYSEFMASLDLRRASSGRSLYEAPSTVALKQARTPEAIAMALLDPKDRSFDGPKAVEGLLADLMIHQVALLDGVMEGVRALLDELSPESIGGATGSGGASGLFGAKYKARWEEFCRRFEKLSEGQQAFSYVFGQDFAEVYRQYWHRKASEDASLRTERPPG
jgi:type VI secretion system protein ImpI